MSEQIVHLTDATFDQEVLQSDVPVVVDYWAEWCGPCKMIGPILEELAVEYGDKVKIAKINIDENAQTPPKFGIRSIVVSLTNRIVCTQCRSLNPPHPALKLHCKTSKN
jgi:thioredoxin 1